MKQLTRPPRALTRRKPPDTSPRNYLIIELPANDIPSSANQIIDIAPEHIHTDHHPESRLQQAIQTEQDYLVETCTDFLAASGKFLGAIFRWLVWRIVLPVAVTGVLLLFLT